MSAEDDGEVAGKLIGYGLLFFLALWALSFVLSGIMGAVVVGLLYYGGMWLHHKNELGKEQAKKAHFEKMLQEAEVVGWKNSTSIVNIIKLDRSINWYLQDKNGQPLKEFQKSEPEIQEEFFQQTLWRVVGGAVGLVVLLFLIVLVKSTPDQNGQYGLDQVASWVGLVLFSVAFVGSLYLAITEQFKDQIAEEYASASFYEGYYFRELHERLLPLKEVLDRATHTVDLGQKLAVSYYDTGDIEAAKTMLKHTEQGAELIQYALMGYLIKTLTKEKTEEELAFAIHCVASGRPEAYEEEKEVEAGFQNACKVLGIKTTSTLKEAKKAHRAMAKKAHSDIIGGDGELMKSINVAFDIFKKEREGARA